jgi:amidase
MNGRCGVRWLDRDRAAAEDRAMDDEDGLARRDLFRLGLGAGAALLGGAAVAACKTGGSTLGHPAGADVESIEDVSIAELQARMTAGGATARSLVAAYRARIAALDGAGPTLRAVLELEPEADAIADRLDDERRAGRVRGPLHGIPILVKDNVDTAGRMMTTAGSLALAGTPAAKDAPLVARLREAGAIILGKANLSEWANFRGNASSSGWSARGGQCRNPYALDRSPSGSSSGSAVATAASLCAAAVGTETDGSITSPASCTALVGLKPTLGLVSRTGVIPIAASQDTAGPMARTVADAAALLTALAGPDPADPSTTAAHPARPPAGEDFTRHLAVYALRGARLGVPRAGFFGINRNVDTIVKAALARLTELGAVLVDPAELPTPPGLGDAELTVLFYELKAGLAAYLASRGPTVKLRTLADVIGWNTAHADRELMLFGQELFDQAEAKGGLDEAGYREAKATCAKARELLDRVMAEHQLDAFVSATGAPPWLIDHVNGDAFVGPSATTLPAVAGYPHVTVPAGFHHGLPVGLSFVGGPFTDGKLLGYAFAFEQATRHRRPPRYLATAELPPS